MPENSSMVLLNVGICLCILNHSKQQPKKMITNRAPKLNWLIHKPPSITATNTAAVNDLVLNVLILSANEFVF